MGVGVRLARDRPDIALRMDRSASIGEAAALLGVPVSTIRSWGERYGVPTSSRTGGGHRRFAREDLVQIALMRDEIASGLPAVAAAARVRRTLGDEDDPVGRAVAGILQVWRDGDLHGMLTELHAARASLGIETAVAHVALTVMRVVGIRWEAGVCDVAEEHAATDVLRTWLAALRSSAESAIGLAPAVLACGPNELHSLGLESFATLLAARRLPFVLLGAATPARSLASATERSGAWAVVLTAQLASERQATLQAAVKVAHATGVRVFCGGRALRRRPRSGARMLELLPDDPLDAARVLEAAWPRRVLARDRSQRGPRRLSSPGAEAASARDLVR